LFFLFISLVVLVVGDDKFDRTRSAEMQKNPLRLEDNDDFLELILGGPVFFQTLRSAVELDIFTNLMHNPGRTLEQLADLAEVQVKPMRILLLGCAALGLVELDGNVFYNTRTASRLFSKDSAENILPTIELWHHLLYKPMFHMAESIKQNRNSGLKEIPGKGETIYERLGQNPDLERIFQAGLQSTSSANVSQLTANFDFSRVRHVLDVGGGKGTALCALAKMYPALAGTVFESPTVCHLATRYIQNAGLSERLAVHAGDAHSDPLPTGADCILIMHFLTIWSEEANVALLKKCFDVLPNDGRIVVFDGMQSNDRNGPLRAARFSPYFLVLSSGHGMFYTPKEYASWLERAGFVDVASIQTAPDHLIVHGRKS
jgi:SAM-dependent methyltransferase